MQAIEEKNSAGRALVDAMMAFDMPVLPLSAQVLHRYGRVMSEVSPLHGKLPLRSVPKECYQNSARAVLWPEFLEGGSGDALYYCEGYAASKGLGIPIEHAWLCDGQGRVIDPTWKEAGIDYFGVTFSREFIAEFASVTRYFGVFCNLYLMPSKVKKAGQGFEYLASGVMTLEQVKADYAHTHA